MFSFRAVKNVSSSCNERSPSPGSSMSGAGSGAGLSCGDSTATGGVGLSTGADMGGVGGFSTMDAVGCGKDGMEGGSAVFGAMAPSIDAGGRAIRFRSWAPSSVENDGSRYVFSITGAGV